MNAARTLPAGVPAEPSAKDPAPIGTQTGAQRYAHRRGRCPRSGYGELVDSGLSDYDSLADIRRTWATSSFALTSYEIWT
jgi:hypothetical protein